MFLREFQYVKIKLRSSSQNITDYKYVKFIYYVLLYV